VAKGDKEPHAIEAPGKGAAVLARAREFAGLNGAVRGNESPGSSPKVPEAESHPKSADVVESSQGVEAGLSERDGQAPSSVRPVADGVPEPSSHPIALVSVPFSLWLMAVYVPYTFCFHEVYGCCLRGI
jgi:hypothetical protein